MTAGKGKSIEKSHKASDPSAPTRESARPAGADFSHRDFTVAPAAQIAGNLAVQQLFRAGAIQAKLTISQAHDPDEQEADRVADRVMRMAEPGPINSAPGMIHRKCATCEAGDTTCATCDKEEKVRRKENGGSQSKREKGPLNFRSTAAPGGTSLTSAPPIVHEVLSSPGQPLGTTERAFMEPRFGQDFSGVRVHTDAKAAESAAAVQARAYTVRNNIVFGGKESASDLPVLAHELTHVVQQSGASPALQRLEYCADFLELTRRPGVAEDEVRDSIADDAAPLGTVETELFIPAGSFAPWRTIPGPRRDPSVTFPQIIDFINRRSGRTQGDGRADVGLLSGSTLEVIEVKEATWNMGLEAETQLSNYLSKAEDSPDIVNELWRARDHPADEITSVIAMPMTRLNLEPNPRAIGGELVSLSWCRDGVIVFKVEPEEEEEEEEPKDKEPKDKEPKDKEPGEGDSLPDQLEELGKELARWLGEAKLLDIGLALGRVMLSFVASPLVALAAVVLGIAYFWDEIKSIASAIAGVARAVWDKIAALAEFVQGVLTAIRDKLYELGVMLADAVSFVAGKVASFVKTLAEGVAYVAGRIWAGGKWLWGEIASGAEAFWDWLWDSDFAWPWGSDVEPMVPNIEMPITEEPTQHCGTVAQDDTIIKLDADLLFDTDEWEIRKEPAAQAPLVAAAKQIVAMLQKDDWIKFEGYTDNTGGHKHNQELSEKRAGAVRAWFVEHGVVLMSRTRIEGYGETMAQYNDPEGRKKDRRVDIWLPGHGSTKKVCW